MTNNVVQIIPDAEAKAARRRLSKHVAELEAEINAIDAAEWNRRQSSERSGESARIDELASAMLAGREPGEPQKGTAARRAELCGELQIARRALSMAVDACRATARREASRIDAALRPEHRRSIQRIARALVELSQAIDEEYRVRSKVPVHSSLPCATFPGIGSLSGYDSPVNWWLRRMKELQLLDDVPAAAQ